MNHHDHVLKLHHSFICYFISFIFLRPLFLLPWWYFHIFPSYRPMFICTGSPWLTWSIISEEYPGIWLIFVQWNILCVEGAASCSTEQKDGTRFWKHFHRNLLQRLLPTLVRGKNTLSGVGLYCSLLTKSYAPSVRAIWLRFFTYT